MPLPDPSKPVDVVLMSDPNLSPDMDRLLYLETRAESLIKDKSESLRAVRFVMHPIPRRFMLAIDGMFPSQSKRWQAAALASLRLIKFPDGTEKEAIGLQTFHQPDGKAEPWLTAGDEQLDYFLDRWSVDDLYALGRFAYEWSRLPKRAAHPL